MDVMRCIGSCLPLFLLAIIFDVLGLILLFIGIFANLSIGDRFYGDFLIYSGSLIIFFSLGFWLMWYVGNVRVLEYDEQVKRGSIVQMARKISERLSMKLKGKEHVKRVEDEEHSQIGSPPHKSGKVTWGKSTAYSNEGYDDFTDSPEVEKKINFNI
ncbi:transmembrane protein 238 [Melanotaenia boesemani]|uniref:transmembrane protein 238 n=1 Tax=Melanotaenia boesemani TaxID=1250792 RepID=UPI001C04900B|nr:transmembrane protein 238 [Melanotaenia boesemani]